MQIYANTNTGGLKYTPDSVVQIRTVLLTSDFVSSTRGKRLNSYNPDHTIWPHKHAAHHVVFKISVGRDLQNSMARLQLVNTMVGIQVKLSAIEADNPAICLHGL